MATFFFYFTLFNCVGKWFWLRFVWKYTRTLIVVNIPSIYSLYTGTHKIISVHYYLWRKLDFSLFDCHVIDICNSCLLKHIAIANGVYNTYSSFTQTHKLITLWTMVKNRFWWWLLILWYLKYNVCITEVGENFFSIQ